MNPRKQYRPKPEPKNPNIFQIQIKAENERIFRMRVERLSDNKQFMQFRVYGKERSIVLEKYVFENTWTLKEGFMKNQYNLNQITQALDTYISIIGFPESEGK